MAYYENKDERLLSRYIKNGAPQSIVIIPTGTESFMMVLAKVSVQTKNIPPKRAEDGIKIR